MPDGVVVAAENLGKVYHIYDRPQDRLRQVLRRWRRRKCYRDFWALRHASFEVRRGETLGVIGRNGAGKSTLLQLIAGTVAPSEGEIRIAGRVAALLELGSGFNPDFTGRENVFIQGVILGLSNARISERFDDITDFAQIGEFIDQPVRTYSSGMVLRLAFAVQVQLDPDILLVDEALAVGDAAFQFKCMGHMRRLRDRGASIILVTHDVTTVRSMCDRVLWLDDGQVREIGEPPSVTAHYVRELFGDDEAPTESGDVSPAGPPTADDAAGDPALPAADAVSRSLLPLEAREDLVRWGSGEVVVAAVALDDGRPDAPRVYELGQPLHVELLARAEEEIAAGAVSFAFAIRNDRGLDILVHTTHESGPRIEGMSAGQQVHLAFDLVNILAPGKYVLIVAAEDLRDGQRRYYDYVENAVIFEVVAERPVYAVVQPAIRARVVASTVSSRAERQVDV